MAIYLMEQDKCSKDRPHRILVTGAAGMTAYYVPEVFSDYELVLTNRSTLDIRDISQVRAYCREFTPDIILHLAAETDVDLCQQDPKHCFLTNTVGTQNVALACQETKALLIYFSTMSVFPGISEKIYSEFDNPDPIHIYGHSKWQGEQLIPKFTNRFIIIRPGWMFGGFSRDKKYVGVLRRKVVQEKQATILGVVDIKGSPTYALDCLLQVRRLIESKLLGTFHVVNPFPCTRFEIAEIIAQHYNISAVKSHSSKFKAVAPRPISEMARNWMLEFYGYEHYLRNWALALKEYLTEWDKFDAINSEQ